MGWVRKVHNPCSFGKCVVGTRRGEIASEERPRQNGRKGDKLSIPLPFDEALKAAMKVPADKLAKPNGKKPKTAKKQPKP